MPGGVNSPVRAFKSVGGNPIFAGRGEGPYLETTDGRRLIDFCMSFGPLILGHGHPAVVEAIQTAATNGTSFAVTTEAEIEMAELIREAIPSIARVRLVSSGTEACMTAIRLARGATNRSKILKFSGCYHGHSDGMLVQAGSGVAGIATASSAGVPEEIAGHTLIAPYNDTVQVTRLVEEHADDLAAIIVEPIAANMGLVLPDKEFLLTLRRLTHNCGALLIFDEVITGFRLTYGGYQNNCSFKPDLTCLGKIIGGGMPIGAVGGSAKVMDHLAPLGPVYQAGTLSGNPISVAAGLATLQWLRKHRPYADLDRKGSEILNRIMPLADRAGINIEMPRAGSMFSFFFTPTPVKSFEDVKHCDQELFRKLFHAMLEQGVYLPPSPFEVSFASIAHSEEVIGAAVKAFGNAFESIGASVS